MRLKKLLLLFAPFLILILLLTGWFYWFQFRPAQIRKECSEKIFKEAKENDWDSEKANLRFGICLTDHGLKSEKWFK